MPTALEQAPPSVIDEAVEPGRAGFGWVDSTTVSVVRFAILIPLLLLSCSAETATPEEQEAREQAFEESMRGAVLDGHFTLVRQGGESSAPADSEEGVRLRSERYEIEKVVKLAGDIWTFHARIQYGERDVTLPVPVKLLWAGDTPMVSLTDAGLPGLGSYTARVLFYRDYYAGMWSGGRAGGSLFGRITRPE